MIRVVLPLHLRTLAKVDGEVQLDVDRPVTTNAILGALEARYPMLCGTVRDHETNTRRPRVRFFAVEEDVTHQSPDAPLPKATAPACPCWSGSAGCGMIAPPSGGGGWPGRKTSRPLQPQEPNHGREL